MEWDGPSVLGTPLLAVLVLVASCEVSLVLLVSVARICEFWLGQLRPMCPWRLHLKHLPSFVVGLLRRLIGQPWHGYVQG
jgi:hypothetical protein